MSVQPDSDEKLAATSGRLASAGGKFFGLAAVLAVIGAILLITDASTVAGLMLIGLALAPTIAGIALTGSGAVGKRAAKQKDFA